MDDVCVVDTVTIVQHKIVALQKWISHAFFKLDYDSTLPVAVFDTHPERAVPSLQSVCIVPTNYHSDRQVIDCSQR